MKTGDLISSAGPLELVSSTGGMNPGLAQQLGAQNVSFTTAVPETRPGLFNRASAGIAGPQSAPAQQSAFKPEPTQFV